MRRASQAEEGEPDGPVVPALMEVFGAEAEQGARAGAQSHGPGEMMGENSCPITRVS